MGAGFQRAIACFIWSQNPGKNQGKYAPKMAVAAAMQRAFQRGEDGARPAPANGSPCSKGARTVHDVPAGEGLPGVQEAARQGRSQGVTPEWPAKWELYAILPNQLENPAALVTFDFYFFPVAR